ncbi:MAG: hypothetical protein HOP21_05255 [Methylotenera sp.]|nr:hypothetical protein [Methylotenera sp.]
MMQNEKVPANKELQAADVALRRAALKAKEEAEKHGTPYVVAEAKSSFELQQVKSGSKQ